MRSAVVVPLKARGQTLGAMTLVGTGYLYLKRRIARR